MYKNDVPVQYHPPLCTWCPSQADAKNIAMFVHFWKLFLKFSYYLTFIIPTPCISLRRLNILLIFDFCFGPQTPILNKTEKLLDTIYSSPRSKVKLPAPPPPRPPRNYLK